MAVIENIFNNIKTALLADDILKDRVATWYWSKKPRILRSEDMPSVMVWTDAVPVEDFFTLPRAKTAQVRIKFNVRVWKEQYPELRQTLIYLDEQIKRTLEQDITLTETAIILKLESTDIKQLTDRVGQIELSADIQSRAYNIGEK